MMRTMEVKKPAQAGKRGVYRMRKRRVGCVVRRGEVWKRPTRVRRV